MSDDKSNHSWVENPLLARAPVAAKFSPAPWDLLRSTSQFDAFQVWPSANETQAQTIEDSGAWSNEPTQNDDCDAEIEESVDTQVALDQAKRDSFEHGFEIGFKQAEEKLSALQEQFVFLIDKIRTAQEDPSGFYDPLKKLSLHLAEEMVRGELSLSPVVIERLVMETIKDLQQQDEQPITIKMNTLDRQMLTDTFLEKFPGIDFKSDQKTSRGSVELSIGETNIEDFLENRLSMLADGLFQQPNIEVASQDAFDEAAEAEPNEEAVPSQGTDNDRQEPLNTETIDQNEAT